MAAILHWLVAQLKGLFVKIKLEHRVHLIVNFTKNATKRLHVVWLGLYLSPWMAFCRSSTAPGRGVQVLTSGALLLIKLFSASGSFFVLTDRMYLGIAQILPESTLALILTLFHSISFHEPRILKVGDIPNVMHFSQSLCQSGRQVRNDTSFMKIISYFAFWRDVISELASIFSLNPWQCNSDCKCFC